ncbi:methyltransferase domain-containing protein [Oceanobacter sp. 4_MG-2023]|uniref:methyltransferase domain-containing protein n=1 Tax=Oceanobacter sp. 4_MG-2023 TaxID=3062623 RepID=UPI0027373ED5|nr:methyltransferase domain-containing protein [Oceanobacter sp. 4_MG-2023]MDP2548865.1 methyltransferase domain-containing protein [Oceanobacter sp. 4_MG-2023]
MSTQPPTVSDKLAPDRNFDDISARFRKTIYDTPKGQLRLAALRQDFADLKIALPNARVLDLGGGQGQFALELARQGAAIHLCDISETMLTQAKHSFAADNLPLNSACCSLQSASDRFPGQFDLVLNHAVLEWLEQPYDALQAITSKVATNGWLSLMFYNRHGHQWRQIMNGRTHAPDGSNDRLRQEGNAPQHPLDPDKVMDKLQAGGFDIVRWRGIRCIHDHMHQKIRDRIGQPAVNQADLEFGLQDPYRLFGRYIHVMARRTTR